MADTVDTLTVFSGTRLKCYKFTNTYVDTGEAAVVKVDKSTLTNGNGVEPGKLIIRKVKWNIQGYTSVKIAWDHTADDEALTLSGEGEADFMDVGGLVDPASTGDTGDLVFTTAGTTVGSTYDITLWIGLSN